MREWTISDYLERLASRQAAPGGGAAAALHAAQAAALVAMVARCTQGPRFAEHEALVGRIIPEADRLREDALQLAQDDAAAFTAVAAAYKLPRGTPEQGALRTATIAAAMMGACEPPAATITAAEKIVALAEELLPAANPNAAADLSAAAQSARAAASVAGLNLKTNLSGVAGPVPEHLTAALSGCNPILQRADQLTTAVRKEIGG